MQCAGGTGYVVGDRQQPAQLFGSRLEAEELDHLADVRVLRRGVARGSFGAHAAES